MNTTQSKYLILLMGLSAKLAAATTSPLAAQEPIQVDAVFDYGYSALLGSTIFNANSQNSSWGSFTAGWTYYNSCPSTYYNANHLACDCNGGGNYSQSKSITLYFGNQYPSTGNSSFSNWSPQTSYFSQNIDNPLNLSYSQITNPTTNITENELSYQPGDITYTIINPGLNNPTAASSVATIYNPVVFDLWNVTGTTNYKVPNTDNCDSGDSGANKNISIDSNEYSNYVYQFNGNNNGGVQPSYGLYVTASDASSNNIVFPPPPSSATTVLSSSAGTNVAQATPVTQAAAANGPTYASSITFNTNSYTSPVTLTLGATVSQQTIQTTQSGSYSSTSNSYNQQQSFSLNDVNQLTVAGEYAGVTASDTNTLTTQYNTAFQESYSNVTNVAYASSTQTNTANTSSMTIGVTFDPTQDTITTSTASGSASDLSTNTTTQTTSSTPGACYTMTILQEQGPAYLNASSTTYLGGNYGAVSMEINGSTQTFNPSVVDIAQFANNFEWWSTSVASVGSGDSSSIGISGSDVTIPDTAQLQSNTESGLELSIFENDCTVSTSSATPHNTQNVSVSNAGHSHIRTLSFVDPSDYRQASYTSLVTGTGFAARNNHGFRMDDRDLIADSNYVLSNANDYVQLGAGKNRVTAGDGNDLVIGNNFEDIISGGTGWNTLHGGPGNDRLFGGPNMDNLIGGDGDDILVGGGGIDHYVPGNGKNILYIQEASNTWIDTLSFRDKVKLGKFSFNEQGKVKIEKNKSDEYELGQIKMIGFAQLFNNKTGQIIGLVHTVNNFISAPGPVWTDFSLVNFNSLPRKIFRGTSASSVGLSELPNTSKRWYLATGFKRGADAYRFADWNELNANQHALRLWIKSVGNYYMGRPLSSKKVNALMKSAPAYQSAATFVKGNFSR